MFLFIMKEKRLFQNEFHIVCQVLLCATFPLVVRAHTCVCTGICVLDCNTKTTASKNGPFTQP